MPVDLPTLAWLQLIILVAAFVQGTVGFAFGMIAMGLGALVLDAKTASILMAPLASANIAVVLWSVRRNVRVKLVAPMLLGVLAGLPFGIMLLLGGATSVIRLMVGLLLLYVGVSRLRSPKTEPRGAGPLWGTLAGLLGGVLGGAVNMAGPPLIAYSVRQGWSPGVFKATLLATFILGTSIKSAALIWQGSLDTGLIALDLALLPAVFLGSYVGIRTFGRIDVHRFGQIVAILLLALGAGLLI